MNKHLGKVLGAFHIVVEEWQYKVKTKTKILLQMQLFSLKIRIYKYSKRYNKFLLPVPAKAIYGRFGRTESEISNLVNYRRRDPLKIERRY